MKAIIKLLTMVMLAVFLLGGCKIKEKGSDTRDPSLTDQSPVGNAEEIYTFQAELLEGGNSLLVAPNADSNEVRSSDKISVHLRDTVIVDESGASISSEELRVGDILLISYDGMIAESYPAQLTADRIERVGHNNLIEGYLSLIDDIFQEDAGLNSDIKMIALDTSAWINLTDIEKELILAKVSEAYGLEVVEGTFEELADQGLINEEKLIFTDGILIEISEMSYNDKKEVITCSVSKWRGGDGAIGASEVTAAFVKGQWEITKEGNWIS